MEAKTVHKIEREHFRATLSSELINEFKWAIIAYLSAFDGLRSYGN